MTRTSIRLTDAARVLATPTVLAHAVRLASLEIVAVFGIAVLAAAGAADGRLLWAFVAAYLSASALAFAVARGLLPPRAHARILAGLAALFLIATALLAAVADDPAAALAPFAVALISGFAIKEAGFLEALKTVHAGAREDGARRTAAIALLSGMQPILVAGALLAAGALGDVAPGWPFVLACLGAGSVFLTALTTAPRIRPARTARATPLPPQVRLLCAVSTLYNAASLLKSRVLVPVYAVVAARALGLDDDVFSLLGLVAGLVGVAAVLSQLLRRRLREAEALPRRMIVTGIVSTSLLVMAWGAIDLLFVSEGATGWLTLVAAAVLLQTATTQLWNVGFFGELTRQAEISGPAEESAERARRYTAIWQLGKNLGAPLGFAVAAFHAEDLTATAGAVALATGSFTLLVGISYALLSPRLDSRPEPTTRATA